MTLLVDTATCPICMLAVNAKELSPRTLVRYSGCGCDEFCIDSRLLPLNIRPEEAVQLSCLLRERALKRLPVAVLVTSDDRAIGLREGYAVRTDELLASWPTTVAERLDRVLCNLARYKAMPGEIIEMSGRMHPNPLCFSNGDGERGYYVDALRQYGWIDYPAGVSHSAKIRITPAGWKRVDELAGGAEHRRNPAFVAMWFGGAWDTPDHEDMRHRFADVIRPACLDDCGWNAERVDSEEHNDSIIDRVVQMIRVAPFVIADLDRQNNGVYYEAGLARGCGVPVIYLVHDSEGCKPHFDVSGVSHVRWSSDEELRVRLRNRVLGTMGLGPHKKGGA